MPMSFLDLIASAGLGVVLFAVIANGVREYFLTKTGPLFMAIVSIGLWLLMVLIPLNPRAPDAFKVVSALMLVLPVATLIAVLLFRQKEIGSLKSVVGVLVWLGAGSFVLWRMGCMFDLYCL